MMVLSVSLLQTRQEHRNRDLIHDVLVKLKYMIYPMSGDIRFGWVFG